MELIDAIIQRRTARSFISKEIPEDVLYSIMEAGTWAPSHSNNQPWEFILIGAETRNRLREMYAAYMEAGPLKNPELEQERKQGIRLFIQNFGNAPVLLAVSSLPAQTELDKYDFPLATAAAIQNILLAAWEQQIAWVWLSFGMNPQAEQLLQIPEHGKVAGIIALGYPEFIPQAQERTPVAEKIRRLP